jgi:N-acetylmuramoyl-L-alanine amidase-like protein
VEYPSWKVSEWVPELPPGRIENIYLHWSAHDYRSVFPAYHFCVALDDDGEIVVVNTHDVRENMRNVYDAPDEPYAAHTRKRNSFALGISVMGMQGSKPDDFGPYPLTTELVDALCAVGAKLAAHYRVPVDAGHIMTHAEAALHDGYFGTEPQQRWDIARLKPEARPLVPQDALDVGEELRARIRRFL